MVHKPIASGIAIIGWGLLIAGLAACGGNSPTQAPTQVPAVPATPTPETLTQASATPASGSAGSPMDTLAPCSIVTQDDASAFFGAPSVAGMPGPGDTRAFCVYATADNVQHLSFNLSYHPEGAAKSDDFAPLKSANQDVPGVGEAAFYDPTLGALTVAKGVWVMRLSGNLTAGLAPVEKLKPLAQTALSRLP